jgi:membrane-associated phospholipid phosphatase
VHLVAAILLCISTVYGRYHYVVDVVAGIAAAAVLVPLGDWLYRKYGDSDREMDKTES